MSCCPKDSLNALKSDGTFKGSKIILKDVLSYYATQDFEKVKSGGKVLIFYPDVRRFTFYVFGSLSLYQNDEKKGLRPLHLNRRRFRALSVKMMKKKDYDHYVSNRIRNASQPCPIALYFTHTS